MTTKNTIIFDFDSTFINCETLDTLASIIYQGTSELEQVTAAVAAATNATMAGEISIHESLVSRVNLLKIKKHHIDECIDYLKQQISTSFIQHKKFISTHSRNIFIFSGGFSEVIVPIVAEFQIPEANVFANRFIYANNDVIGIDENCMLAHNQGKARQLESLQRSSPVYVIGDGITDAEIKNCRADVLFYLYTENVFRKNLVAMADKVIANLDEFIFDYETATSTEFS